MLTIQNLLKNVYCCIRNISKKCYRDCAVIVSGLLVFALISLNTQDFGGTGKNKTVPKECNVLQGTEEESTEEETDKKASIATPELITVCKSALEEEQSILEQNELEQSELKQDELRQDELRQDELKQDELKQDELKQGELEQKSEIKKSEREVVKECINLETVGQIELPREPVNPYQEMQISETDHEALCRIVQAEAGGEDERGKILVAEVILNRVLSEQFADTVTNVIFEKSGGSAQFSPTVDGRYFTVAITEETREAVEKALHEEDISEGALFFSARSKANPNDMAWFDRHLKRLFQYGGHEFYTLP